MNSKENIKNQVILNMPTWRLKAKTWLPTPLEASKLTEIIKMISYVEETMTTFKGF